MRKLALLATLGAIFLFSSNFASAQVADAMLGFGTTMGPGADPCTFDSVSGFLNCPEKGGLYPSVAVNVHLIKGLGFNFESTWKASQGEYGGPGGQPFRPIIFDFNGLYSPKLQSKKVGIDLLGGIGWQSTRFYGYTGTSNCVYFGACYVSSNHFLEHVGAGVRIYVHGHFFVRPEAHFYHIQNNTNDFTNNNLVKVGASIGYTIGPD